MLLLLGNLRTESPRVYAQSLQSCLTLCDPTDCSLPGSSVHGIPPARILEWVALPSSRGSARSRGQTHVSYVSCIGRQVLYHYCHLGSRRKAQVLFIQDASLGTRPSCGCHPLLDTLWGELGLPAHTSAQYILIQHKLLSLTNNSLRCVWETSLALSHGELRQA